MAVSFSSHGNVEIVRLPRRLIMATADETRSEIQSKVDEGRHSMALDLESVEFVDSSGLGVLIYALKSTRSKNGNVVLVRPNDEILSLLELTKLVTVFDIYDDRDAAIEYLQ